MLTKKEIAAYFRKFGEKGGRAGRGRAKRRGDAEYYRALALKSVKARKAKKAAGRKAKPGGRDVPARLPVRDADEGGPKGGRR
jgi:hypothetical protein